MSRGSIFPLNEYKPVSSGTPMQKMMKYGFALIALVAGAMTLAGCGNSSRANSDDYAELINRSGRTGMRGNGPFASGSNSHPGYTEMPIAVGAKGSLAPATGNYPPITDLAAGSRGPGIANDSGGIGIGVH